MKAKCCKEKRNISECNCPNTSILYSKGQLPKTFNLRKFDKTIYGINEGDLCRNIFKYLARRDIESPNYSLSDLHYIDIDHILKNNEIQISQSNILIIFDITDYIDFNRPFDYQRNLYYRKDSGSFPRGIVVVSRGLNKDFNITILTTEIFRDWSEKTKKFLENGVYE